jgi:hypothetical protein
MADRHGNIKQTAEAESTANVKDASLSLLGGERSEKGLFRMFQEQQLARIKDECLTVSASLLADRSPNADIQCTSVRSSGSSKSSDSSESQSLCEVESSPVWTSIGEFARWACEESRRAQEEADAASRWQTSTWHFARLCKGSEYFKHMSERQFKKSVPWRFTDFEADERIVACTEFANVRIAAGDDPLTSALWLADERPVLQEADEDFASYQRFLNCCYWLACQKPGEPVYFPCHKLGPLLGLSARTISSYRRMAISEGYITVTQLHTRTRATRFRVNLTKYQRGQELQ